MAEPATLEELPIDVLRQCLACAEPVSPYGAWPETGPCGRSLCAAEAVSRHWQASAAGCWSTALRERFSLSAAEPAARRIYAVEDGWRRGRFTYSPAQLPDGEEVAALAVDAASASALVATVRGGRLRVPLPGWSRAPANDPSALPLGALSLGNSAERRAAGPSTEQCPTADCAAPVPVYDVTNQGPREETFGRFRWRIDLPTVAARSAGSAAASVLGAVWGRDDGTLELVRGWRHADVAPRACVSVTEQCITAVELLPEAACGGSGGGGGGAAGSSSDGVGGNGEGGGGGDVGDGGEAWRPRVLSGCLGGEVVLSQLRVGGGAGGEEEDDDDDDNDGGGSKTLLRIQPHGRAAVTALAVGGGAVSSGSGAGSSGSSGGSGSASGSGCLLVGGAAGHVSVVDVAAGRVSGSILSSCACPPLCLSVLQQGGEYGSSGGGGGGSGGGFGGGCDGETRQLFGVTRHHAFTGSGHGDFVALYDSRSLEVMIPLPCTSH